MEDYADECTKEISHWSQSIPPIICLHGYELSLVSILEKIDNVDGLVQDCGNSIANTLELPQSCTKPSMLSWDYTVLWAFMMAPLRVFVVMLVTELACHIPHCFGLAKYSSCDLNMILTKSFTITHQSQSHMNTGPRLDHHCVCRWPST